MGGKVRQATLGRVPYIGVVGDQEVQNHSIALKSPKYGDFGVLPVDEVQEKLFSEVKNRAAESSFDAS